MSQRGLAENAESGCRRTATALSYPPTWRAGTYHATSANVKPAETSAFEAADADGGAPRVDAVVPSPWIVTRGPPSCEDGSNHRGAPFHGALRAAAADCVQLRWDPRPAGMRHRWKLCAHANTLSYQDIRPSPAGADPCARSFCPRSFDAVPIACP
jgi:hypothetical protein